MFFKCLFVCIDLIKNVTVFVGQILKNVETHTTWLTADGTECGFPDRA
jgi:hypothetical protein